MGYYSKSYMCVQERKIKIKQKNSLLLFLSNVMKNRESSYSFLIFLKTID